MRKLLLILIALCPLVVNAQDDFSKKYTWSYGALADTMKVMRKNCELTHSDEFLEMGNWFRNKAATFSMRELIEHCKNQKKAFSEIDRSYKKNGQPKECQMPQPCDKKGCSEKPYTNISGCNIFISTFLQYNNARAKVLNYAAPGTYVEKQVLNNETVYKIMDVILADGYWQKNKINQAINMAEENTKIYDISTGQIVDTGLRTMTNDMFFDVQTGGEMFSGDTGYVRGAYTNSYIRPSIDVTSDILALYDAGRGKIGNSITDAYNSRPNRTLDIKRPYGKKYKIGSQEATEAEANGVMFAGKIASLDFLGNMLFGMNNQEAVLPNFVGRGLAQGVSLADGFTVESQIVKNAWDIGQTFVLAIKASRIDKFKKTQTRTKQEAYQMAEQEMKNIYPDTKDIVCTGNCNPIPGTDDVVICTDSSGNRLEFVFDDICDTPNSISTTGNTYSGSGTYFKPGMK